ncbi:Cytochrome monooxygenase xanG [Penicillium hispanicum]|uniref:Cytochrome monooxygenase xanG n=1 Tax=Penicillium hispanicum TaxID=1080232 RepID=UPI002541773D|nr:Cytochrome monooxygenase xanG [Penicillium hispanicum]KAJ5580293.1 Cytochrome monooxygenase xanG [Penicillium hispanicum]
MIDWTAIPTWARGGFALLSAALLVLYWYIRVPGDMPKNIPTVPIYISLLGLWSEMGQDTIYDRWLREPLEKHGAVKIWFAGRWNVLATRPQFLVDMFRHEDIYAKAGSQKKIPWSVIAALVGDNIINAHGDNWKLYTSIMKPGLQRRITDSTPLLQKSRRFVDILLQEQAKLRDGKGVLVNPIIQRWALSCMGLSFMNVDLEALENPGQRLEELQTIIKKTLFKPLFFNFPDLDRFPKLFPQRRVAFAIMQEFGDLLVETVRARPQVEFEAGSPEQVVDGLDRALKEGKITEEQYRANLKVTFLTAHENAQQLLNSTFWELGNNQAVQRKLRAEVLAANTHDPSTDLVNSLPYLFAVVLELLRLYPPVSQLINRVTTQQCVLGSRVPIPNHTWVGWNAFGVHTDPRVWGADAREFIPERWGTDVKTIQNQVRSKTTQCHFIAFNAHSRKCLGQGFAVLQMKILLFELVRRIEWRVDPAYELKLTSGGILAPLMLRVTHYRVGVLVFEGADILDFTGPIEVLSHASYARDSGEANPVFKIQIIAQVASTLTANSLNVETDILLADALEILAEFDILVVPGATLSTVQNLIDRGSPELDLVRRYATAQPKRPRILFSVCTGAILLGAAGILAGITATTHHQAINALRDECAHASAPNTVPPHIVHRRFVDGGMLKGTMVQVITAGGISSGLDATFYIVCRLTSAETASSISQIMEYGWSEPPDCDWPARFQCM